MKRILSLAAVASMALAANAAKSVYQDKDYSDWGKLKLVGNQLSDQNGNPVQLKGWSTFSLHYKGVCEPTKGQLELMKQYGANIVRLAMYVDDPSPYDGGGYIQNGNENKFQTMVTDAIRDAKALNMYVLVDWHILEMSNGSSGDPTRYTTQAKEFFSKISKFCNDGGYDNVLYEICNEPHCGWSTVKNYAKEVIPSITANQPDAIIVVGSDQWCQLIKQAATDKLPGEFSKNVMYSFHYYACSHHDYLNDFIAAQNIAPVFVSEWSAVKFDGDGPFCKSSSDDLIGACANVDGAPQVVSWCLWNWGTKDEASSMFKEGGCRVGNESAYYDTQNQVTYGNYVKELMMGEVHELVVRKSGPYETLNNIPTTDLALWRWDYYDLGGEGVAYHDGNGGAYEKDKEGLYTGYKVGDEFDIFSTAYDLGWLETRHNLAVIDRTDENNPVVVSYDNSVETGWKDGATEKKTYRSLNGGRMWGGPGCSERPDEGVDLSNAGLQETGVKGTKYTKLAYVEAAEYINFTVNVAKPGYYKISGYLSAEYGGNGKEIQIANKAGNLLRDGSGTLSDSEAVTEFGFTSFSDDASKCAKPGVILTGDNKAPWDCWNYQDAKNGKKKLIYCAFPKAGEQELFVTFAGDCGGVGPLQFEFVADLDENDPQATAASNVEAENGFEIYPNPTSGEFTVALADGVKATVEIVNMAGQVVASQEIEGATTINKALAAGIYTVVVKSNGAVNTEKLVVK